MSDVEIQRDTQERIAVTFPYNLKFVAKIKAIKGYKWHPDKKCWSFPNSNGTIEKILKTFESKEIQLAPLLQVQSPTPVIASTQRVRGNLNLGSKQSHHASRITNHDFEDLKRKLLSRKYSSKTVKAYIYYNKNLLQFVNKNPFEITDFDVKNYLFYLAEERQSTTSTLNQAINALKFYYGTMLKKKFIYEVKRPRKDKKLPVVLNKEEVVKILSSVDNIKHKTILMLVYSAGLRVGEVVRLKVEDIDSQRRLVHIKDAKGRKDRYTMLSDTVLEVLREYWKEYRPTKWLFPGPDKERYITTRTAQRVFEIAREKALIKKNVTIHSLRHA